MYGTCCHSNKCIRGFKLKLIAAIVSDSPLGLTIRYCTTLPMILCSCYCKDPLKSVKKDNKLR